ncbi:MAG: cytidylate kinase family protein [Candidatus Bathyarchaeota archaeon]|nr:cytidylate kinase family protein [Candidatus Bathyarchaeota archaeon]
MPQPNHTCQATPKMVICISGMAGTGKSTLAKKIAEKYGLRYYSGGDALKALAKDEGYDITIEGWWENPVGIKFLKERVSNPKFDKAVDDKLLQYASEGNVLLDSWTMPWLYKGGGFKIWLEASFENRAARVAQRDNLTLEQAVKMLKEKEDHTKAIYLQLYGFVLGEDLSPFDFVLDTNSLNAVEVFEVLCRVVDKLVLTKSDSDSED